MRETAFLWPCQNDMHCTCLSCLYVACAYKYYCCSQLILGSPFWVPLIGYKPYNFNTSTVLFTLCSTGHGWAIFGINNEKLVICNGSSNDLPALNLETLKNWKGNDIVNKHNSTLKVHLSEWHAEWSLQLPLRLQHTWDPQVKTYWINKLSTWKFSWQFHWWKKTLCSTSNSLTPFASCLGIQNVKGFLHIHNANFKPFSWPKGTHVGVTISQFTMPHATVKGQLIHTIPELQNCEWKSFFNILGLWNHFLPQCLMSHFPSPLR